MQAPFLSLVTPSRIFQLYPVKSFVGTSLAFSTSLLAPYTPDHTMYVPSESLVYLSTAENAVVRVLAFLGFNGGLHQVPGTKLHLFKVIMDSLRWIHT